MSTKTIELHTCDDCKHVILLGRGGIHISCSGGERLSAKWAGGFEEHGKVAKGHAPPAFPMPKGCSTGPFDGLDTPQARSVTLCRACLARRLGFKDDTGVPEDPASADAPDRFNHKDPV